MQKVRFVTNRAVWQLGLATGISRELTAWPDWKFCPMVLQLAWLFSSPECFTSVPPLATRQLWVNHEIQSQGPSWVHTLELFFTLSHTLPLHDSHLNTRFLSAILQANLSWNKANTWLIKFNLTISPFGYSVTKHPKTDYRLNMWVGNNWTKLTHI